MAQGGAAPPVQNRSLTGDIFIVTRGGTNYKLGLVTVTAITEGVLQKHLARKKLESELELSKLQPEIDSLKSSYDKTLKTYWDDVGNETKKAAMSDAKEKLAVAEGRQGYLMSAEFVYDGLGRGISSAKTDADGKFTIQIPRRGRVALAARGSREAVSEEYFWIVWVEPQTKRVMLSNDNMMGQGSPESAWR